MQVKSVNLARSSVVETKQAQLTDKRSLDSYENAGEMLPRNAEIVLQSSEKAVLKVKGLTDATLKVLESERTLELAINVRDLKTELRAMQKRHEEGETLSKSEVVDLRRRLWKTEVGILDIQTHLVCETLINDADFALFDLVDAKETPQIGEQVLGVMSQDGLHTLTALGVLEGSSPNSLRVTPLGLQILKDALGRIEEVA